MPPYDPRIDNIKGVLMILVVMAHLVYPVPNPDPASDVMYVFVYVFHMPMFALVSGYLSHASVDHARVAGEMKKLLAPYAVFIAVQQVVMLSLGETPHPWYEGWFGLWFLLSLFCWRMLLPWVMRVPYPLVFSLLAALACGYAPLIGLPFSLSRTVVFLPFFLAGYLLRKKGIRLGQGMRPVTAAVFLLVVAILCVRIAHWDVQPFLYGAFSYEKLKQSGAWGPMIRSIRLFLAFGTGFAVMALIPAGKSFLTAVGRRSLYVYLLHGPLLAVYRAFPQAWENVGQSVWIMVPASVGVAVILSSEPVVRMTRRLVSPFGARSPVSGQ